MSTPYRFLLTPRWIAFSILVVLLAVLLANLGFWQLRRYHDKHDANERIADRTEQAAVPVEQLADDAPADVEWRTVTATGSYDAAEQVVVRNRSFEGTGGLHVVTPLVLADGSAVLVNRGWIPLEQVAEPPEPAGGTVTVTARVRESQQRGRLGPRDPAEGDLAEVARVDVPRLQQQVTEELLPFYVELVAQEPAPSGRFPLAIPVADFDDGPHLSYAVQWWIFSLCAVAGWVVVVRKSERQRARAAAADGTPTPVSASQP